MAIPPYNPSNDPRWQRDQTLAARDAWKAQARVQKEQWKAYRRSLRRTSIVGPLLVVALGVVFLLIHSGKITGPAFALWYAHWWPVLLIGIGLFLLAEWFIVRVRRAPGAPPVSVGPGAGFGFLIFFLIAFGIGLNAAKDHVENFTELHLNGDDWEHLVGSKHESDPAPILSPLSAGAMLTVDNPHGDISVVGLSDDGQLHLTVHNEVYSASDSDAESKFKQLEPIINGSGEILSLRVPSIDNAQSEIKLSIPANTRLTLNANRGDVHVSNLKSGVNVTANHGDVDLKGITGPVTARVNHSSSSITLASITGAVNVQGRGNEINVSDINGRVNVNADFLGGGHMQHIRDAVTFKSSKISFALARLDGEVNIDGNEDFNIEQALGPVTVDAKNRNVNLTRVSGDLTVTDKNGEVEIGMAAPLGAVRVENHNGSVHVSLPDQGAFTVQADTADGEVHSDFILASRTSGKSGSLSGTINGGGQAIRLTTTHGDIALRRSQLAPLNSTPPEAPVIRLVVPSTSADTTAAAAKALVDAREQMKQAERGVKQAQDAVRHDREQALKDAMKTKQEALREAQKARDDARKNQ